MTRILRAFRFAFWSPITPDELSAVHAIANYLHHYDTGLRDLLDESLYRSLAAKLERLSPK